MCDKEIFAVSKGEYSDYRVEGIFLTENLAQLYLDKLILIDDEARMETFPLNPEPIEVLVGILVTMTSNGDTLRISKPRYWQRDQIGFQYYGGFQKQNDKWPLTYVVETDDEKRAIKVVNEKRAIILASDAWDDAFLTKRVLGQGR